MLLPEHRAIGVVVDQEQLGSAPQVDREGTLERHAHGGSKRGCPALDGPERRRSPIDGATTARDFTVARKNGRGIGMEGQLGHRSKISPRRAGHEPAYGGVASPETSEARSPPLFAKSQVPAY